MTDPAKPTVHIDGTDYPLDAYSPAQIEWMEFGYHDDGGVVEELECLGVTPDDSATAVHHDWQKNKAIVDGRLVQGYVLARVYRAITALWNDGTFQVNSEKSEHDVAPDEEFARRMAWLNDRGGYTIWVRRADTGDGIILADTIYMVAFSNPKTEAAFLAAFPEAAR